MAEVAPSINQDETKSSAREHRQKIFVRKLVLDAHIGVYEHEQGCSQPIIIDIEADVIPPPSGTEAQLENILCYDKLTSGVKSILAAGHIDLVETLVEKIADLVLSNPLSISVMVRVEKPNAVSEAEGVGVEIIRSKSPL